MRFLKAHKTPLVPAGFSKPCMPWATRWLAQGDKLYADAEWVSRTKIFKMTTISKNCYPNAPNVLERKFEVTCRDASRYYLIVGLVAWLCLAVVIDLHSRTALGGSIGNRMTTYLSSTA